MIFFKSVEKKRLQMHIIFIPIKLELVIIFCYSSIEI